MVNKHCCFKDCKSDSRRSLYDDVTWVPIVKPSKDPERASKWIEASGRDDLKDRSHLRHFYVCSKHFIADPKIYPHLDPLPAGTEPDPLAIIDIKIEPLEEVEVPCQQPIKTIEPSLVLTLSKQEDVDYIKTYCRRRRTKAKIPKMNRLEIQNDQEKSFLDLLLDHYVKFGSDQTKLRYENMLLKKSLEEILKDSGSEN